jgi:hypothetical protein
MNFFSVHQTYIIRVGSIEGGNVIGREATVASIDTDGVLNGDCLLTISNVGLSSIV